MLDALETQLGSTRYALGDRPSAVNTIVLGGLRAHANADPIPDLSGYTRILEWEAECDSWRLLGPADHLLGKPEAGTAVERCVEVPQ